MIPVAHDPLCATTTLKPARWMMVAQSGSWATGIIRISFASKYCLKRLVFFMISGSLVVVRFRKITGTFHEERHSAGVSPRILATLPS
jgi:hypothetical protein